MGQWCGQWSVLLSALSGERKRESPAISGGAFYITNGGALAQYVSYFLTLTVGVLIFAESITTFGTATVVV